MNHPLNQQTLVLAKPDALQRGLVGEIISRLEKVGLKLIKAKLLVPSKKFAEKHYPVTTQWLNKVGNNTLTDCQKYGFDPVKMMGTKDPMKLGHLIHQLNVEFFTNQPVLAMVWEGVHAVEVARKLAGATVPILASPGTIRGDFVSSSALSENCFGRTIQNLIHTSDDLDEAKREIDLWFGSTSPQPV